MIAVVNAEGREDKVYIKIVLNRSISLILRSKNVEIFFRIIYFYELLIKQFIGNNYTLFYIIRLSQ